jgi:putative spermidine/putrescine transport system ATP-binding protein
MVVMNRGTIAQVGTPHQIYNRPASEFVARFMGGHNVLNLPVGKAAVRSDHMRLAPQTSASDGLPATITDVEYQGTYVLLTLQALDAAGATAVAVMVPESAFGLQPCREVGDRVSLSWDASDVHLLAA